MWIFTVLIAMTCVQHRTTQQTVLTAWTVVCAANSTCAWADKTFQEHSRHCTGTRFRLFLSHPCSSGDPMFGLITCEDIHTFVCHWARLASSSKLASPSTCISCWPALLVNGWGWSEHYSLSHEIVYLHPFASQRWTLFSAQFQTRRNLRHILLVNAWQDLRCRNTYRQPWVLTRQAALPGYHTLIRADINGHRTQGKQNPTYFKMFLKVSDDVINILDNEGQSEEESHLAYEFWI